MSVIEPRLDAGVSAGDGLSRPVEETYPRARLRLGIASVGAIVTVCAMALIFDVAAWLETIASDGPLGDLKALGVYVGFFLLLGAAFDLVGGRILPLAHGRPTQSRWVFGVGLVRGIVLHGAFQFLCAWGLLHSLRSGGWPMAAAFIVGAFLFLTVAQRTLVKLLGDVREEERSPFPAKSVGTLVSAEEGFAGGITGLPGLERIDLPGRWRSEWPAGQIQLALARRRYAVQSGLYWKGLALAVAWNVAGAAFAAWVVGAPEGSVSEVAVFSLLVTLWSFVGLLVLPTASRNAVIAMDREMIRQGRSAEELAEFAADCALLQDGEIARNDRVETFFHPIPSLEQRWVGLETQASGFAGWNASRQMLYFSWPMLGMVSRAVHGNVGRPTFWVMPPAD
jgi:hypothetical protein